MNTVATTASFPSPWNMNLQKGISCQYASQQFQHADHLASPQGWIHLQVKIDSSLLAPQKVGHQQHLLYWKQLHLERSAAVHMNEAVGGSGLFLLLYFHCEKLHQGIPVKKKN